MTDHNPDGPTPHDDDDVVDLGTLPLELLGAIETLGRYQDRRNAGEPLTDPEIESTLYELTGFLHLTTQGLYAVLRTR